MGKETMVPLHNRILFSSNKKMNFSGKCIELVLESARKAIKGKPKLSELWTQ